MDPTFAQNLVAAILDKHMPQNLNQTVKNSHMTSVSGGFSREATNRTLQKQGGDLRDIIAQSNGYYNKSPTKSSKNFIAKNKQLCASARDLKGSITVSANKAE